MQNLLVENDRVAARNRARFDEHGVRVINLMSSPGAGKTALLEATIVALKGRCRIAVIEGDPATARRTGRADHDRGGLPSRCAARA